MPSVRVFDLLATGCAIVLCSLPFLAAPAPGNAIRFENRGLGPTQRFVLANGTTEDKPVIDSTLGGVALLDYDNDGYLDIFFTNGASIPSLTKSAPSFYNRLFHNNRDGTFTDVTARAGLRGAGYSMGVAAADYDNDGWVDLYVAGVNRNILYHNNGDGTFTDATQKAGVSGVYTSGKKPWSVAAAWLDYDNDGRLDLLVVNYLDWSFAKNQLCGDAGRRVSCTPALYKGETNILYHNNGDGTFTDVSEETGIGRHIGKGMSAAIADYDGDGFIDILVTNDREPNFLFHNAGGKKFTEVGVESAVALTQDGMAVSNMGVDFRDLDNDGWPDVLIAALQGETFLLFFNSGKSFFTESSYQAGVGYASRQMSGWSVGGYDFDNDGYKDLFTSNSHVSENVHSYGPERYRQPNAVFRNIRNGQFQDVGRSAGISMNEAAAHRGSAFGDLNNDGKVDVVVSAIGSPAEVLYNTGPRANHWLIIQAVGTKSNRDGIGTRIKIVGVSGLTQYNHVTTAVGYASSSDKRVHFGLGRDARVRRIELRWPSGKVQVLTDVASDQILKVIEP
ncbi:MAG TPA: CRTAC1 family protein [Bryobacteraceae bacterium]|nr:CRTAC1 family protein [Bryobacteraceae bacterium]